MDYRWLTDEEVETLVNPGIQRHGWAMLNLPTCRVLGAFDDAGTLVESLAIQLHPLLGPLMRHDNTQRDNGTTSRELTRKMEEYLEETQARGWMVIADHPVTERLCERHGMTRVVSPVFLQVGVREQVH